MTTTPEADRHDQVRSLVDRAVMAAVPPGQTYDRKIRPESTYGITTPYPRAGLEAGLLVVEAANRRVYGFAKDLRGEGLWWVEIADLLGIAWSPDYHRPERAYELVAGNQRDTWGNAYLYWTCAGPAGCGKYITDRGPYDARPDDCEVGHDEECVRHANDIARYSAEYEERERRARVMEEYLPKVTDSFGQETVDRVKYVLDHGGRWLGWSTSEALAVALVLRDKEQLAANGYSTQKAAIDRIRSSMGQPANPQGWLRLVRLAATGAN